MRKEGISLIVLCRIWDLLIYLGGRQEWESSDNSDRVGES